MACLKERRLASADKAPPEPFDVIGPLQVMARSRPRPTTPAQPCRIAFGARVRFSWTQNLITGTNVLSSRSRLPQRLRARPLPERLACLHGGGTYDDAARRVLALNRL